MNIPVIRYQQCEEEYVSHIGGEGEVRAVDQKGQANDDNEPAHPDIERRRISQIICVSCFCAPTARWGGADYWGQQSQSTAPKS